MYIYVRVCCRESDRPSSFYILDARGQLAAAANMAAGKGTEDVTFYNRTELIFCGTLSDLVSWLSCV